jgi:hypothetical protein
MHKVTLDLLLSDLEVALLCPGFILLLLKLTLPTRFEHVLKRLGSGTIHSI